MRIASRSTRRCLVFVNIEFINSDSAGAEIITKDANHGSHSNGDRDESKVAKIKRFVLVVITRTR